MVFCTVQCLVPAATQACTLYVHTGRAHTATICAVMSGITGYSIRQCTRGVLAHISATDVRDD